MPVQGRRTVVVCIGNELVADDAVGFEIYQRLCGRGARVEFCSLGGIDLLPLLAGETALIVVDAVQLGAAPGTVHVLPWDALPRASAAISAHGLGLRETVEIGRELYPESMPERIVLVGIEGRCFNRTRDHMTGAVQDAIASATRTIEAMLEGELV